MFLRFSSSDNYLNSHDNFSGTVVPSLTAFIKTTYNKVARQLLSQLLVAQAQTAAQKSSRQLLHNFSSRFLSALTCTLPSSSLRAAKSNRAPSKTRAKKFWLTAFIMTIYFSVNIFAQQPQTPQFGTFQQTTTSNPNPSPVYIPNVASNGNTANDIIRQQNMQAMKMMGYNPPVVPPSDPALAHQFILNQYKQDLAGSKSQKELMNILNEAKIDEAKHTVNIDLSYFKSNEFTNETKSFSEAKQYLKDMLYGKTSLSVRNAFYKTESAYGNTYLSQKEFNNIVKESANFISKWLKQNGYNPNNNEDLHLGIQKFMTDTLTITVPSLPDSKEPKKTITHFPFGYDYDDYKAEKDHRNFFVTKTFATGYGQCSGLPEVYISIAEALGAKVYLTLAPNHTFVKYPLNNGQINNYEPTSHWNISDQWYKDNMFISQEAIKSGIFLDTMNRKMIVADCMLNLASSYLKKYGMADGTFINDCINTSLKFYPRKNNIQAYFLRSCVLARELVRVLRANNITDLKDVNKIPEAKKLQEELQANEALITALGYQETPEGLYEELMQQHEFKGKVQQDKNINGKEKRNLFVNK